MSVKKLIEKKITGIKRSILDKPEITSPYGKGYWQGNVDGLKWALKTIRESGGREA